MLGDLTDCVDKLFMRTVLTGTNAFLRGLTMLRNLFNVTSKAFIVENVRHFFVNSFKQVFKILRCVICLIEDFPHVNSKSWQIKGVLKASKDSHVFEPSHLSPRESSLHRGETI